MKLSKKKINIKNKKKSIKQTGCIFVDIENGKVVNNFKFTAKHKTLPNFVSHLGQFEKYGHGLFDIKLGDNVYNIGRDNFNTNRFRDFYIYKPEENDLYE